MTISLRLPRSAHLALKDFAKKDGISMNQLVVSAIMEKISAFNTEEYIEKRAKKVSKEKFQNALSKIPDTEADEFDRI